MSDIAKNPAQAPAELRIQAKEPVKLSPEELIALYEITEGYTRSLNSASMKKAL